MMKLTFKVVIATSIVFGIFFIALLWSAWDIYSFGKRIEWIKADAAIVLGAAAWGRIPSPVFRERINHAITLYKMGYVHKIIFTGGAQIDSDVPESIVARNYAMKQDIPQEDILCEKVSKTTDENLLFARNLARQNGLKTFLIVSDPLHMKRAMQMAADFDMEAYPSPTPTTRYQRWYYQLTFLFSEVYKYNTYMMSRIF